MATPRVLVHTFTADAAIANPYTLVAIGATGTGTLTTVKTATAPTDKIIGTSGQVAAANAGDRQDVTLVGVDRVLLGGTVNAGDKITAGAGGVGVAAAPAAGINNYVVGMALQGGASGDIILVLVNIESIQG